MVLGALSKYLREGFAGYRRCRVFRWVRPFNFSTEMATCGWS